VELVKNKSKFVKVHASSGYKRSIAELLGDEAIRLQLGDVKAADEVTYRPPPELTYQSVFNVC
jgi:hypothetical protein